ncbi:MAG: hypothetical protein AAGG48_05790 [Planctomycetota bacterium]
MNVSATASDSLNAATPTAPAGQQEESGLGIGASLQRQQGAPRDAKIMIIDDESVNSS